MDEKKDYFKPFCKLGRSFFIGCKADEKGPGPSRRTGDSECKSVYETAGRQERYGNRHLGSPRVVLKEKEKTA